MTMWAPRLESTPKKPLYLALADALSHDIAEGTLRPGARLPTHRELADRLAVTVGTVSRGYAEAARRGLLSGEVGRGTFVRAAEAESVSDEPETEEALVDLTLNHPPQPELGSARRALEATLVDLARGRDLGRLLGYPPDGGAPSHREAGARWLERSGLEAPPERVLVCSGSQHGLTVLLTSRFQPGDLILSESLTYPGLKAVASLLHLRLEGLPLDESGLRADAFEDACRRLRPRGLYCVPTIQNPTSSVMSDARRGEIAEIARRHDVAILEDDIHALLPESRPLPIASFAPERSYYITSTSKSLAPGLRIAFILAPPGEAARLAAAIRATTWAAPPLMAELAARWIGDGTADRLLAERRAEAAARQRLARERLAGFEFRAHPFGYHLWLALPEPWRSEAFVARARSRGVAVTPSEAFVVGRAPAPHAVRLGLGAVASRAALERGLERLAATLREPADPGFAVV